MLERADHVHQRLGPLRNGRDGEAGRPDGAPDHVARPCDVVPLHQVHAVPAAGHAHPQVGRLPQPLQDQSASLGAG